MRPLWKALDAMEIDGKMSKSKSCVCVLGVEAFMYWSMHVELSVPMDNKMG